MQDAVDVQDAIVAKEVQDNDDELVVGKAQGADEVLEEVEGAVVVLEEVEGAVGVLEEGARAVEEL